MGVDREVRAWRIRGRVQGVGFRWSTVREARQRGIEGRVWNRPDGAVEVHARGSREALDALERWLSVGPRAARVDEVEEVAPGPRASAAGFEAIA